MSELCGHSIHMEYAFDELQKMLSTVSAWKWISTHDMFWAIQSASGKLETPWIKNSLDPLMWIEINVTRHYQGVIFVRYYLDIYISTYSAIAVQAAKRKLLTFSMKHRIYLICTFSIFKDISQDMITKYIAMNYLLSIVI